MKTIARRKQEHIQLAQRDKSQLCDNPFDSYSLPYCALPEIDLKEVSTQTTLLGKKLSQPLIIASMSGGTRHGKIMNRNIALAAEEAGVAFGVGSQRIGLINKEARDTFTIARKNAPRAIIFANMGAIQLNYGLTVADYQRVVDMIEANALYLHLNPLQEALQPKGDTKFSSLLKKIEKVIKKISVPVFIKEVGHGIDKDTARKLVSIGVAGIDVAGVGGTSWAWIEGMRRKNNVFAEWFKEYGVHTDEALIDIASLLKNKPQYLVASGGIRSPLDGLKSIFLGAHVYSCAQPFLKASLTSETAVLSVIEDWRKGLQITLFSCGMKRVGRM